MSYHDKSYEITLTKDQLISILFGQMVGTQSDDAGEIKVFYLSEWDYTPAEIFGDKPEVSFKVYGQIEGSNRYGISGTVALESSDNEKTFSGTLTLLFEGGMGEEAE